MKNSTKISTVEKRKVGGKLAQPRLVYKVGTRGKAAVERCASVWIENEIQILPWSVERGSVNHKQNERAQRERSYACDSNDG